MSKLILASDGPSLVTVPNVPIVATGIEYNLASGPATFTEEDLVDAVASQDDPAIRSPRLGLGHIDPRTNGPQYDADPSFGKAVNLRLSSDGQVIIADYVGVPKWLAEVMPVAYPNRSIEGTVEAETVTGHKWGLVISAVKLLGVKWPGISVLEDLPLYYGEEMPPGIEIINPETGEEINAMTIAAASGGSVTAATAVEDVRRAFYDQLDADQMWWWIRSMYLDPNELIVDDDDGQLYRVPFAIKGEGVEGVEFSDPVEVKIQYVNAAGRGLLGRKKKERQTFALVASAGREVAQWNERAASRPADNDDEEEVVDMKIDIPALRSRLQLTEEQLPDDASEDQVNAAIAGETPAPTPQTPATPPAGDDEPGSGDEPGDGGEEAGGAAEEAGAARQPVAASGMVSVPASEWERVQGQAARGAAVADTTEAQDRERIITAAIEKGKIAPADRESYTNMFKENAESARRLLTAAVKDGGLREGLIPVTERGVNPSNEEGANNDPQYDRSWLSASERARIKKVEEGDYEPPVVQADQRLPTVNGNRA